MLNMLNNFYFRSEEGVVTAGKDGVIKLWSSNITLITSIDLATTQLGADQLCVRSVVWVKDLILVGTKTSVIIEVDVKDRTRPRTLVGGHGEGEMWALATHPSNNLFATGSDDCTVRIWDSGKHVGVSISQMTDAVRSLSFSANGKELAVGLRNGDLVLFEFPAMVKVSELAGNGQALHELKFSPSGEYLAAGYNDGLVLVFNTSKGYSKPILLKGHTDFISHLDWSKDSDFLFTNAGVSEEKVFSIATSKEVTGVKVDCQSYTRVIGSNVKGIYPKFMKDVNDVNAVDVDFNTNVAVTGDDYGNVKLFSYPVTEPGSKSRRYIGHSAHVTNVRFNHSKDLVITTGGEDHSVFQWKIHHSEAPGKHSNTVDSEDEVEDYSDAELDSDTELETQICYERKNCKDDLKVKKKVVRGVSRPPAPDNGLVLDFVFGYRGYDCRNNIFYTAQKEIVYHVAALGILYNPETNTQRFYTKHTDDILCLSLHPMKDYVATGQVGKDAVIHVWDIEKCTSLSILKGQHQRGVVSVDFSNDGKMLASVGLDDNHTIVVWGWRKGEKIACVRGSKQRIFSLKWGSSETLVSVGVRHINFWSIKGASLTSKRGTFGKKAKLVSMMCSVFNKQGTVCYSGGENGLVHKWNGPNLAGTVEAHSSAVYALCSLDKGFVSGGKDGSVCLWDEHFETCLKKYSLSAFKSDNPVLDINSNQAIRGIALGQGKIVVGTKLGYIFEIDKSGKSRLLIGGHSEGEVWGLATHPTEQIFATVSDDGTLKVWDGADKLLVLNKQLVSAGRSVAFSNDGKVLAVGFKTGDVQIFSTDNYSLVTKFKHRKENISDVSFSPKGNRYLAVASHDNFVDIYSVPEYKRVGICKGASSYITHIDWDSSGGLIMSNSGAKEALFFEAPKGTRVPLRKADIISQKWHSWTSVLSPLCEGIWPPTSDVTDVNASHLSSDGKLIATGDDYGFVKLFEFPSLQKHAKCKKYVGHSAHVTNVRWTKDDNFLVTIGGGDTSVMMWSHRGLISNGGESDESDDEAEEDGYDSDVEFECTIDYNAKTYSNPVRIVGEGVRPDLKEATVEVGVKLSRNHSKEHNVKRSKTPYDVNSLSLHHVFGYRGYDARGNIHFIEGDKIVYHAAGLGIVMSLESKEQSFYTEHTDDILCLSVNKHPKYKNIVATGQLGKTAQVLVWDAAELKTVSILQGFHTQGITAVNFSSSGKLLVTVGLDEQHSMAIWQWQDGTKLASVENNNLRILHCEFRPDSDTQLVSVGQRHVTFWSLAGMEIVSRKPSIPDSLGVKMKTMLSIAFSTGGITYTGSIAGEVFVWQDVGLVRVISNVCSGPVFSLFTTFKDGLIVSGGKEKTGKCIIKLWDQSMKRSKTFTVSCASPKCVVKSLCRSKGTIILGSSKGDVMSINERSGHSDVILKSHGSGEVSGVAVHPSKHLAATVSNDKTVRLWELDTLVMEGLAVLKSPALCADFHPNGSHLAVGCNDGSVIILSQNLQQVAIIRDNASPVLSLSYSPNSQLLAVAAELSVSLYNVQNTYTSVTSVKQLAGSVLQLDWSVDSQHLAVSLATYQIVYVKCAEGFIEKGGVSSMWNTCTTVLGDSMVGIWPKNSARFDVNCAHVANGSDVAVSGDDMGTIKLFEYPCTAKYAKHKKYFGHSAHITAVRFTFDDKYLISSGGDDSCVFLWKTQSD